jgi:hypothetical protein
MGRPLDPGEKRVIPIDFDPDSIQCFTASLSRAIEEAARAILPRGHMYKVVGLHIEVESLGDLVTQAADAIHERHPEVVEPSHRNFARTIFPTHHDYGRGLGLGESQIQRRIQEDMAEPPHRRGFDPVNDTE